MYSAAGEDLAALPWASLKPFPLLVEWLDGPGAEVGGEALVVGTGLGDDAEELARRGFAVTAFDLSPTAIAGTVAPGGLLWLFALGRESHQPGETRPWPVTTEELAVLEAAGLTWETHREDLLDADLFDVVGTLRR